MCTQPSVASGDRVGSAVVGAKVVGFRVGISVGFLVGSTVGAIVGVSVTSIVGATDGENFVVGCSDGS